MDYLVTILMVSAPAMHASVHPQPVRRSIYPWSWESSAVKEPVDSVPGYLPALQVHKYNGVQINPVNGPPIYLSSAADRADPHPANDAPALTANQFQGGLLAPEYTQQLQLLDKVVAYLPDEGRLQDYDFSALLPYVDLISEDSLARIQYAVETGQTKQPSKLLKVIGFVKALKEKKLKPFKAVASLGATLFGKKKQTVNNMLHLGGGSPAIVSTTPPPAISTLPGGYPIHYPPTRPPNFIPSQPIYPTAFPIMSAPPSEDTQQLQQQQQQQQQPVAPPANANPENRFDLLHGHDSLHYPLPAITPADTHLAYPLPYPLAVDVPQPPFAAYYAYPPSSYQQPPFVQPRYQFPHPEPSTSSSYQQQQQQQPPRTFHSQQTAKTYPLTPAHTYLADDLAGSASDNVEKVQKESSDGTASSPDTVVTEKEGQGVNSVENDASAENPMTPKTTKLRLVAPKPPVYVYSQSVVESKPTDSESTPRAQPLASSSPAYESNQ